MAGQERIKREAQIEEHRKLSEGVTRAILTLIHADEFLMRVDKSFQESVKRNGEPKIDDLLTTEVMSWISLFASLQNGTYKHAETLNADIRLISAYNQFDYAAYIKKMHEMILKDLNEQKKDEPADQALPNIH